MNELNKSNYDISFGDGVITFKNINTTLGYARYNQKAEIEYIFVNPTFRRKGLAKKLLQVIEEKTNIKAKPQEPISSLGKKLFKIKNK
jgi:GNAT superfamily N-acetyltransferase